MQFVSKNKMAIIGCALIVVYIIALVSVRDTNDTSTVNKPIYQVKNLLFQSECKSEGGTVYPTRYGYGGCIIEGYSVNEINGIGFHD